MLELSFDYNKIDRIVQKDIYIYNVNDFSEVILAINMLI